MVYRILLINSTSIPEFSTVRVILRTRFKIGLSRTSLLLGKNKQDREKKPTCCRSRWHHVFHSKYTSTTRLAIKQQTGRIPVYAAGADGTMVIVEPHHKLFCRTIILSSRTCQGGILVNRLLFPLGNHI